LERTFDTLEDQFSMTTTAEVDLVEEIPDALIIAFREQCARIDSPSGVGKPSATRPNALNCSITRLFSGVQSMKTFFTIATLALATALVGCNNSSKQETAAPGAVSGNDCSSCSSAAAPGAVSSEACGSSCSDAAAPGAVSSEACGSASSCSDAAAPGAVSSEACGSASSCSDAAAPGAVSSDDACGSGSGACPFSGQAG
jgi:hypothetical protein